MVKEKARKKNSKFEFLTPTFPNYMERKTIGAKVSKLRVRKTRARISTDSNVKKTVLKLLDKQTDWVTTRQICNLYHGLDKDDESFTTEEIDSFLQNVLYSFKVGTIQKGYSGISCVWALPKYVNPDTFDFIKKVE